MFFNEAQMLVFGLVFWLFWFGDDLLDLIKKSKDPTEAKRKLLAKKWKSTLINNLLKKVFSSEETLVFALLLTGSFLILFFLGSFPFFHFRSYIGEFSTKVLTGMSATFSLSK